ncbi:hypothetical protein TcYC6_0002350 [Trypanosoma cruzi]|nr:hypothetical protein TcYC6_0002350 [Trypanosoma cruzi]
MLARHVEPFDLPQNTVRYLGKYTTVLAQVSSAGRIDVKGETAEGQEPWLRAEGAFSMIFIIILSTITRRATRTRPATPQDERNIPLQQVNVPVLNPEWVKGWLNPATLERLVQAWGLVVRSPFPLPFSGKAHETPRGISNR